MGAIFMWFSGVAALTLAAQLCQSPKDIKQAPLVIGLAYAEQGQVLQYCEWHLAAQEGKQEIIYATPKGEVLAISELDLSSGGATPSFTQTDFRSGEMRSVQRVNNHWQLQYRAESQAKTQQKSVPGAEVEVVGPGFVTAIAEHWQQLMSEGRIDIVFASSVFQRTIDLRVQKKAIDDCPSVTIDEGQCFWVQPQNPFLRWFASRLELVFDNQKRLRLFSGTVNLQSNKRESQQLQIVYYYAD